RLTAGATVAYVSRAPAPVAVRLDVVRVADGRSVFDDLRTVEPHAQQTIAWEGETAGGLALDGRYEVRLSTGPAAEAEATTPASTLLSGGASAEAGGASQGAPPPPGSA